MGKIWIARRAQRKGLYLPMVGNKKNPSLMFYLPKVDQSELDDLVRAELAKQGITKESDVQAIIKKAEAEYEQRVKTTEASVEVKRLMKLKKEGAKLISIGRKKWREVWYPAIK